MDRFGGAPPEQLFPGELRLRGFGVETKKSAALLSASVQPPAFLKSAVVLPGDAVGPDPSKQFGLP